MNFIANYWWLWVAISVLAICGEFAVMSVYSSTYSSKTEGLAAIGMVAFYVLIVLSTLTLFISIIGNVILWANTL